jgi:RNA polymerase sigma-70 factor, ECF subfamily
MLTIAASSMQVAARRGAEPVSNRSLSDKALIEAIADGDRHAMQELYLRHNARIHRFVLRLVDDRALAEDVISDVFLDVWRRADAFEAKSQVSTWLLAIARHKALSARRRRVDDQLDERVAAVEDPADGPETIVHCEQRSAVVRKCLAQLPMHHREVLDLVYYHEKSVEETARIVGVCSNTVKTRMFYARKRLQNLLAATGCEL